MSTPPPFDLACHLQDGVKIMLAELVLQAQRPLEALDQAVGDGQAHCRPPARSDAQRRCAVEDKRRLQLPAGKRKLARSRLHG
jgi:hypothetical protein